MNKRSIWLWALMLGLVAFAVVSLSVYDDSLGRIASRGVLRVGYAVEAPYALVGEGGKVTGESPVTAELIAAKLGFKRIEWIQVPFAALIPSLLDRRFDMIAAGMFVTPERSVQVLFSRPTLRVTSGLLVRKGNPKALRSYANLTDRKNIRVAVLNGAVEMERLKKMGLKSGNLLVVPDTQAGIAAVGNGTADALALSLPTTRWIAMRHANRYESVSGMGEDIEFADEAAMAFHPEDGALQRAWDEAALEVIGSPAHLAAIAPFGFRVEDLMLPHTEKQERPGG